MTVFEVAVVPEPEGIFQVKASHNLAAVAVTFDEDNLVPNAGMTLGGVLAQRLAIAATVQRRVRLDRDRPGAANCGAKAVTVLGAMLAGADCIDDVDVLRAGAAPDLFDDVRAPSTIGTWLRAFKWSNVRELDAVCRETLKAAWAAGLGPTDLSAPLTIDIDSSICQTYGPAKQGAKFGYTKVRGYHPLLATIAETGEVVHVRMRGGNAASARGAASFIRETVARIRDAGATGPLTLRADSAFYSKAVLRACRNAGVKFSVTVRMDQRVRAAIDAIGDHAWTPIPYWLDGGADVAEIDYTCFSGRDAMDVRLIVRRVRPTPGSQLALDVVFNYHALVTNRDGATLTLEADHRAHAGVELVIRDLKAGALNRCPSGKFNANAAWAVLAALAHNLGRWILAAAGPDWRDATVDTLRRKLIVMPARLVRSARRWRLRTPTNWPWRHAYQHAHAVIAAIPPPG
ncbi:MAG: IS1380 family transposase [Actinomycetota bacterium]|nr:IS1380 family transposase [Actinomycetota bacterium]